MRITVPNLPPGVDHAVEVRAIRDGLTSEWSNRYLFTTTSNGTGPAAPTSVTWTAVDDAFKATWSPVTTDGGGGSAIITSYEVELTATSQTRYISVPSLTGADTNFTLTFAQNVSLWGTPKPSIDFRVRAVNNKGIKGTWSGTINAANARPGTPLAPTDGVVAKGGPDTVTLSWLAPADNDLSGYNVYTGASAGFSPVPGNRIYSGVASTFIYNTTTYAPQYFKIFSVDKFGQESLASLDGNATPTSPGAIDTTPPATPTSLAATLTNNPNGIGATAAVTWNQAVPAQNDLSGFYIRYRKGSDNWSQENVAASGAFISGTSYAAVVSVPVAYTNYDFQIKSYDFLSNESAWTATAVGAAGSNTAPPDIASMTSVPGKDSITYSWPASAATDLKNYEVTFSTNSGFTGTPPTTITYLTGTSNALTVGGLTAGTTYYARVRAVDTAGLASNNWSSTDTETTGTFPVNGVTDVDVEYLVGTSGTTPPTGTWLTTPQATTTGEFLWTRTTTTYTSGPNSVAYSVAAHGATGSGTPGTPATSVSVGNDAVAIPVSAAGAALSAGTITIPFSGWVGSTRTAATIAYSALPAGITLSSNTPATSGADGSLVLQYSNGATIGAADSGTITLTVTCNGQSFPHIFSWARAYTGAAGGAGGAGVSATSLDVTPDVFLIPTDSSGNASGNGSAVVNLKGFVGSTASSVDVGAQPTLPAGVSAVVAGDPGLSPTITFSWLNGANIGGTSVSGAFTWPVVVNGITFNANIGWARAPQGAAGGNGTPATSVEKGNDAVAIPTTAAGVSLSSGTITIPFSGWTGNTRTAATIAYGALPAGITLNANNPATSGADGSLVFNIANAATIGSADSGTINLTITCNGIAFPQLFSWSRAYTGAAGTSATSVDVTPDVFMIPTTSAGVATGNGPVTVNVKGFVGSSASNVTALSVTSGLPTNVTATPTTGANANIQFNWTNGNTIGSGASGTIVCSATVNGIVFTVNIGWARALQGGVGPTGPASDGQVPGAGNTPDVLPGLSYLYAKWAPTTLNVLSATQTDPVTYEVHLGTSLNFAVSPATKVTEVSGTSVVIDNLPGTNTPLSYLTNYYVRIVPKDRDGAGAASSSNAAGVQISKVASGDVANLGADLIVPGNGFVGSLYVSATGSIQSNNWNSLSTGWKIFPGGIEMNDAGSKIKVDALQAGTIGGSPGAGVINVAAGTSLVLNGGVGGGYIKSNTYTGTSQATNPSGVGFYLGSDGLRIDQGIIKAEAFAGGSFTTGTITMNGGSITGGSGGNIWTLSSTGLSIPNGGIQAAHLNVQNGDNIMPPRWSGFESIAYPASVSWPATLLDDLVVAPSTAQAYADTQSLKIDNAAAPAKTVWLGDSLTDYNVRIRPNTRYLVSFYVYNQGGLTPNISVAIKHSDGTTATSTAAPISGAASWVRQTHVVTTNSTSTINSGMIGIVLNGIVTFYVDAVQVEEAVNSTVTAASPYAPPGSTRIDGGIIRTGEIRSLNSTNIETTPGSGIYEPVWSIPLNGAATFASLRVLGNAVVGNGADDNISTMASSNYVAGPSNKGGKGWRLSASGAAEFKQVSADGFSGSIIARNSEPGHPGLGSTVELRDDGFYVKGSDALGNPEYITFPTSGAPNIISGTLLAEQITVSGKLDSNNVRQGATFRGLSHFELDSEITLDNIVGTPLSPPTVTQSVDKRTFTGANLEYPSGFAYDNATDKFWRASSDVYTENILNRVHRFSSAGVYEATITVAKPAPPAGGTMAYAEIESFVKLGSYWYIYWIFTGSGAGVLSKHNNDATWSFVSKVDIAPFGTGTYNQQTLGKDATQLLICAWNGQATNGSSRNTIIRHYDASTLAYTGVEINTPLYPSAPTTADKGGFIGSVMGGEFDYGSGNKTYIVTYTYGPNNLSSTMRAFNASGAAQSTREWEIEDYLNGKISGMVWDGVDNNSPGNFWHLSFSNQNFYRYSRNMWTGTESPGWAYSYSWFKTPGRTATVNTTNGSVVYSAAAGTFLPTDVGADVSGANIPPGTQISTVDPDGAGGQLTAAATTTGAFTMTFAYETLSSQHSTFIAKKRRVYTMTGAVGPGGSVVRPYLGRGTAGTSNYPTVSQMHLQGTLGGGFVTYTTPYNVNAALNQVAPKTSNGTFAPGNPGRLYSQQTYTTTVTPVTTNGTTTITGTGSVPVFGQHMVGATITGTNIPANTKIVSVAADRIGATLSQAATGGVTNSLAMTLTHPSVDMRGDGFIGVDKIYARQVLLTSTTDVNTNQDNMPPLRIGNVNDVHTRFDGNEIQTMKWDGTAGMLVPALLMLNNGGGGVKLGGGGANITSFDAGNDSRNTNANSDVVVPHNCNATPTTLVCFPGTPHTFYMVSKTSTNFTLRVRNAATGALVGSGVNVQTLYIALVAS